MVHSLSTQTAVEAVRDGTAIAIRGECRCELSALRYKDMDTNWDSVARRQAQTACVAGHGTTGTKTNRLLVLAPLSRLCEPKSQSTVKGTVYETSKARQVDENRAELTIGME